MNASNLSYILRSGRRPFLWIAAIIFSLLLSACASGGTVTETPTAPSLTPSPTLGAILPDAMLQAVRSFLVQKLAVPEDQIEIVAVENVDWPDSCLGLPAKDEMCSQVVTPGYRISFTAQQVPGELHTSLNGGSMRLAPMPGQLPTSTAQSNAGSGPNSGIVGQVTLGPACPGPVKVDTPCPDKPYQASFTILDSSGAVVQQFQTDADGNFKVPLAPGTYTLHPETQGMLPIARDQVVTVPEGQFVSLQIKFDSGMR